MIPGRRRVWAAVALAVALGALLGWVAAGHGRPPQVDLVLHAAALRDRTPVWISAAAAITNTAEGLGYALAAAGGLLALLPRPWWRRAVVGAATLGGGQLVRYGLSLSIGRPRPPIADWARPASGFALPSGHTTTATLAAGLFCLGLIRTARGAWRVTGVALAAGWAVAVGLTRIYLGVHWPTDVLGGWLLGGLLTVLATSLLVRPLNHDTPAAHPPRDHPPARHYPSGGGGGGAADG